MLTTSYLEAVAPDAVTGKSYDAIKLACDSALAFAESYTNKRFSVNTYTEDYDGPGHEKLCLKNYPIVSVSSVKVDFNIPPAFGSTSLVNADLYIVRSEEGQLVLRSPIENVASIPGTTYLSMYSGRHYAGVTPSARPAVWPRGYGVIRVVYSAGYGTTHAKYAGIRAALVELATYQLQYGVTGGVGATSISYIDVSQGVGFLQGQMNKPPLASAINFLSNIREIAFGTQTFG